MQRILAAMENLHAVTSGLPRVRQASLIAVASNLLGLFACSAQAATAVLVGAGDIASCSSSGDQATAKLIDAIPGTVVTVGDNVYSSATLSAFSNCYQPSWGRHKARTRPAIGNHEYKTAGASGYFGPGPLRAIRERATIPTIEAIGTSSS